MAEAVAGLIRQAEPGGQSLQDGFEWFQDRNLSGLTAFRLFRDQAVITGEDLPFDCCDAMPPVDIAESEPGDFRASSREERCEQDVIGIAVVYSAHRLRKPGQCGQVRDRVSAGRLIECGEMESVLVRATARTILRRIDLDDVVAYCLIEHTHQRSNRVLHYRC